MVSGNMILSALLTGAAAAAPLPPLPEGARLALEEDWRGGEVDPERWYVPRKKWGAGNHGVSPENVRIEMDVVNGGQRPVLVCQANGDRYSGPVTGHGGNRTRVGGIVVTREFFASGRFEVVMKIGGTERQEGGPADPTRPAGAVPAVWTYGYRFVSVPEGAMDRFHRDVPLYNPHMPAYGTGANEYWSELDFPEFGKDGNFDGALYNTFLQNRHETLTFDVRPMIDGKYHTLTTDWRTRLVPLEGVTDAQVTEHLGHHWVQDKSVPFESYFGNPLKRLGKDRYAVRAGESATHHLDGVRIGENLRHVPAMAAQLTMGVWLPGWGGPADWETAEVSIASVKVWQFDDPGDVRGVLTENIRDNFADDGKPLD